MGIRKPKDSVCPYMGEMDESGNESLWKCNYASRTEEWCKLTNPNLWETKCPYVLEAQEALKYRKAEVQREKEGEAPLIDQAKNFIDTKLGIRGVKADSRSTSTAIKDINPIKVFLLSNAHPLIHGREVLLYYITPEDFEDLLDLVTRESK